MNNSHLKKTIFLGSFSIQGKIESICFKRKKNLALVINRETKTTKNDNKKTIFPQQDARELFVEGVQGIQWLHCEGNQQTSFYTDGILSPALGIGNATLNAQGAFNSIKLKGYPVNIPSNFNFPIKVKVEKKVNWIYLEKTQQKNSHNHIKIFLRWWKMSLGMNQASLQITDTTNKKYILSVQALGIAEEISLAPWKWSFEDSRLIKRQYPFTRLDISNDIIQIDLSIVCCGTGVLKGFVIIPSTGEMKQFLIENHNPFDEVIWKSDFKISTHKMPHRHTDIPIIEIHTDSNILGLHQADLFIDIKQINKLLLIPSILEINTKKMTTITCYEVYHIQKEGTEIIKEDIIPSEDIKISIPKELEGCMNFTKNKDSISFYLKKLPKLEKISNKLQIWIQTKTGSKISLPIYFQKTE